MDSVDHIDHRPGTVELGMAMSNSEEHRRKAHAQGPIAVGLITVSDTRTAESDVNGAYLREAVEAAGHRVVGYQLVPDEPDRVLAAIDQLLDEANAIVLNGGTGISARDRTYDALAGRLERTLPGFGELFRMLSWEQVGSAAMLSRAVAGTVGRTVVFSVPGAPAAVQLAWERLIAAELQHVVGEMRK